MGNFSDQKSRRIINRYDTRNCESMHQISLSEERFINRPIHCITLALCRKSLIERDVVICVSHDKTNSIPNGQFYNYIHFFLVSD